MKTASVLRSSNRLPKDTARPSSVRISSFETAWTVSPEGTCCDPQVIARGMGVEAGGEGVGSLRPSAVLNCSGVSIFPMVMKLSAGSRSCQRTDVRQIMSTVMTRGAFSAGMLELAR